MLKSLIRNVEKSVVGIHTFGAQGEALSFGTGFFISASGRILTNRHLLAGAARAEAKLLTEQIYQIKGIVAESMDTDAIALDLENPPQNLIPLQLVETIPEKGERIIVIGNPLGLERTVSEGIVSACRDVPGYGEMIQITAPTSPGSSGSPVVNLNGQVIGIVTAQRPQGQNLNFAIPSYKILKLEESYKVQPLSRVNDFYCEKWLDYAVSLASAGNSAAISGDDIASKKYYEQAINACKEAVRIRPDNAEAYFKLGCAYFEFSAQTYTEAVEAYKQATRLKPRHYWAWTNLGVCYSRLSQYQDAIAAFNQAINIDPTEKSAYINLRGAYSSLNRHEESAEISKKLIQIDPKDSDAYYFLGVSFFYMNCYAKAIEAFRAALKFKPDIVADASAHYYLGLIFLSCGNQDAAIREYQILQSRGAGLAKELFAQIYNKR